MRRSDSSCLVHLIHLQLNDNDADLPSTYRPRSWFSKRSLRWREGAKGGKLRMKEDRGPPTLQLEQFDHYGLRAIADASPLSIQYPLQQIT